MPESGRRYEGRLLLQYVIFCKRRENGMVGGACSDISRSEDESLLPRTTYMSTCSLNILHPFQFYSEDFTTPLTMKLDANKQAALDPHNQSIPPYPPYLHISAHSKISSSTPLSPRSPPSRSHLDEELAVEAEAWALQMAITGDFSHVPQCIHGENLAYLEIGAGWIA